jgi:hypothetical protein
MVSAFISCQDKPEKKSESLTKIDKTKIIGEWLRTDSDYMIKISQLNEDGSMVVQYLNPKSINVGKAEWINTEGYLKVYIELRDQNYPGSNYNLTYIPEKDMLVGDYYQAVEGLTFYVEFARRK